MFHAESQQLASITTHQSVVTDVTTIMLKEPILKAAILAEDCGRSCEINERAAHRAGNKVGPRDAGYCRVEARCLIPGTGVASTHSGKLASKLAVFSPINARINAPTPPRLRNTPYRIHHMATAACAHCGAAGAGFLCGRCRKSLFCSTVCQREAWTVHKKVCRADADSASELAVAALPPLRAIPVVELERMSLADVVGLFLTPTGPLSSGTALAACRVLMKAATARPAAMLKAGGLQAAIAALEAHPSCLEVAYEGTRCLAVLSNTSSVAVKCAEPASLGVIVATLTRYSTNEDVCKHLCLVLAYAAEGDERAKDACCAAALPLIIRVISQHTASPDAMAPALCVLAHFINERPSSRAAAVACGATPIVARLLPRYAPTRNHTLLFHICNGLRVLTADPELEQADLVVEGGGMQALLRVLDGATQGVARAAAGVLTNVLAGSSGGAAASLLDNAGAPVVVGALRRNARDQVVVTALASVVLQLVYPSEGAKAVLVAVGAIPALIAALHLHAPSGAPDTVAFLCQCLSCIACPCHGGSWAAEIAAGGATAALAETARRRFAAAEPEVAEAASMLIGRISAVSGRGGQ